MQKKKLLKLLPLGILIGAELFLLGTVALTNVVFMRAHIVGLVMLGIVTAIQFFNEEIGYKATAILLLLGTFAVAAFTPTIFTVSVGVIRFDVFCVMVLPVYAFVHRHTLPDWIIWIVRGDNA